MDNEICTWCLNTITHNDTIFCSCGMPINREKYIGLDFFLEVCEMADNEIKER